MKKVKEFLIYIYCLSLVPYIALFFALQKLSVILIIPLERYLFGEE